MTLNPLLTSINHFGKGTAREIRKKLNLGFGSDPFMRYKEIDLFVEILRNLKPKKIFEYGSGTSTLYYPDFLEDDATWISLEHDREWYENVKTRITNKDKIFIHQVDPEVSEWVYNGDYNDFKTYVDFPRNIGKFDLILVDGMARESCIDRAVDLLNPDGLLILHDGNINFYQPHIKKYPNWMIFEDYRKNIGGFGLSSIGLDIKSLFDVNRNVQVWSIDSKIHNFFKFKFLIGKKTKPFRYLSGSNPKS